MLQYMLLLCLCVGSATLHSQELFVIAEPASNMPAKNLGVRIMYSRMKEKQGSGYNTHLMPEIMYGITKNLMVHSAGFISNRNLKMIAEGGSVFAKYKFLNKDDIKSHFRMAVLGRYSRNKTDIHQEEINLIGHNSGLELGAVATQLKNKLAINLGVSYITAYDNGKGNTLPATQARHGAYYTLSFGKLMLPKTYTSYRQTNFNLMLELLGQTLPRTKKYYFDIVPSAQFIINSKMRIDIAYRAQLKTNMNRTAPNGMILKFEYNFFNIVK